MTTFSGHASTSYAVQGEMVGHGARRRITDQQRMTTIEGDCSMQADSTSSTRNLTISCTEGKPPQNGYKRRERRHIYHDILPLKIGAEKSSNSGAGESSLPSTSEKILLNNTSTRHLTVKPAIPPKPKYILRDKRLRHVYQTIDPPCNENNHVVPPPLPDKPTHLMHLKDLGETPPPLPPRVVNKEAIKQRRILDQEYFENLRRSVDEDLLDLAEEGDLPVLVPLSRPGSLSQSQRHDYGAHSPPLNITGTTPNNRLSMQRPETPTRRHSLPIYESISGDGAPALPVRPFSHDFEAEEDAAISASRLSEQSDWEVNLAQNLILLKKCGWYWGNMTWQEAEKVLAQREQEGAFLMRDSQNPIHLLTMTVRSTTNTVHHVRVEYSEGKFQLYEPGGTVSRSAAQCVRHANIEQFINLAIKHSTSGSFLYFLKPKNMGDPPVQLRFLVPISRLSTVKSLQYFCRMVIRKCVVADLIPSLHVPPRIQQYLMSGPFYDPNENL